MSRAAPATAVVSPLEVARAGGEGVQSGAGSSSSTPTRRRIGGAEPPSPATPTRSGSTGTLGAKDSMGGAAYRFRVVMCGSSCVGKTSVLRRWSKGEFTLDVPLTAGASFAAKTLTMQNGVKCRVDLWDTAGQEQYRSLLSMYLRETGAVLLLFDISDRSTFTDLQTAWLKVVYANVAHGSCPMFCVGAKCDLQATRQVTLEEATAFAKAHDMTYLEVSAKTDEGVDALLHEVARQCLSKVQAPAEWSGKTVESGDSRKPGWRRFFCCA